MIIMIMMDVVVVTFFVYNYTVYIIVIIIFVNFSDLQMVYQASYHMVLVPLYYYYDYQVVGYGIPVSTQLTFTFNRRCHFLKVYQNDFLATNSPYTIVELSLTADCDNHLQVTSTFGLGLIALSVIIPYDFKCCCVVIGVASAAAAAAVRSVSTSGNVLPHKHSNELRIKNSQRNVVQETNSVIFSFIIIFLLKYFILIRILFKKKTIDRNSSLDKESK